MTDKYGRYIGRHRKPYDRKRSTRWVAKALRPFAPLMMGALIAVSLNG